MPHEIDDSVLKNNFKVFSEQGMKEKLEGIESKNKIDEREIISIEGEDFLEETASILGGELEINGISFPAPTTGCVMFLDLIDSPFIKTGHKDVDLSDIYDALFILKYRQHAVKDIYGIFNAKKYLDKYENLIEKSPEYLEVVIKHRIKMEESLQKFHSLAADFGEKLGVIDIKEIAAKISDYIVVCFGGFDMIPKSGNSEKKN